MRVDLDKEKDIADRTPKIEQYPLQWEEPELTVSCIVTYRVTNF